MSGPVSATISIRSNTGPLIQENDMKKKEPTIDKLYKALDKLGFKYEHSESHEGLEVVNFLVSSADDDEEEKVCGYCKEAYTEWGNNGLPVIDAQVCDKCNYKFVIPARIDQLKK